MINDRPITISAAGSRIAKRWPAQQMLWGELVERLRVPARSTETLEAYLALSKPKQDDLKDVGGFVGGVFDPPVRKPQYLKGRDIITLDLDNIPTGGTADALKRIEGLGVGYCVYSTRKHREAAPRLRMLVLLNRTATADEYEPIARMLGKMVGIDLCDPTTFQCSRLMYWPSCCADSQYVYQAKDAPMLDTDGMLALYADWRDTSAWPQVPGTAPNHARLAAKQGVPEDKPGAVGAFCRVYDVPGAIDKFLPGVYEDCDIEGRYTFTGGSTTGGAVLYDNGQFLFSHHATDPCGGRLVNAFDLVRLHLFGDKDDAVEPGTPVNRLPSFGEMLRLAAADSDVATLMRQERYAKATEEFGIVAQDEDAAGRSNWLEHVTVNPNNNKPEATYNNVLRMLEGDPLLRGRMRLNDFADCPSGLAPLPWSPREGRQGYFTWTDDDDAGLYLYTERVLGIKSADTVSVALRQCMRRHAFNPVTEYLNAVQWDGVPRLDTYFIDFLGAEDCDFVRTVTRKILVAAVMRAFDPGTKFDEMLVLRGPQGTYKSTVVRYLGGQWYSDSVITFDGKDGAELVQGCWIVEIPEMHALKKSDMNVVKSFLSRSDDKYREAYGKRVMPHPRRCVMFGTTNDEEYLQDPTGNRRFWPVNCMVQRPTKSVITDLNQEYVNQVWAEAVVRYQLGEPAYLTTEMAQEAERRREVHLVRDPMQGQIEEFLSAPIPSGWYDMSLEQHLAFWGGRMVGVGELVGRDRVCAAEIIRECFGDHRASIDKREAIRVNAIMERIQGWERASTTRFGATYGTQKGFKRAP